MKPSELDYDKKKMLKNGYLEVEIIKPVEGLEKGDVVFTRTNEFGQLGNDAVITVLKNIKDEDDEIMIPKRNVKIKK